MSGRPATYTCIYHTCADEHHELEPAAAEAWMDEHAREVAHSRQWPITFRIDYPHNSLPAVAYRDPVKLEAADMPVATRCPSTGGRPIVIPGYSIPAWATERDTAEDTIDYRRLASVEFGVREQGRACEPYARATLCRHDQLRFDPESQELSVTVGEPFVHLLDVEEIPLTEAPKLIAALMELVEAAAS